MRTAEVQGVIMLDYAPQLVGWPVSDVMQTRGSHIG